MSDKAKEQFEKARKNFKRKTPPKPWLEPDLLKSYADFLHKTKDFKSERLIRASLQSD